MAFMRTLLGFLRASWERSIDSAGRVDLIVGLILTLVGRIVNVDWGVAVAGVVLAWLILRVLLWSPAAMWREAEAYKRSHRFVDVAPMIGSVEPGAVVTINNYYGQQGFAASSNTTAASAGTASGSGMALPPSIEIGPAPADD